MANISEIFDKIIKQYESGGGFGEGELALLKRAKTTAMAGVGQQLASAGLAGTTAGAGVGQRWEEEIGMPARLRLQDIRTQRLSQALLGKAGYMQEERRMEFQAEEAGKQRVFGAEQARLGRRAQPSLSDWMAKIPEGRRTQPTTAPTPTTRIHAAPDFTIDGGADTRRTLTNGYADPTAGQPVLGTSTVAGRAAPYVGPGISEVEKYLVSGKVARRALTAPTRTPVTSGYQQYVSGVEKLGGTEFATPSQFQTISGRLQTMYPGKGY